MTSVLGDALCRKHGWMSHVFVHEGAHAVAALDRSIPFSGLFVNDIGTWVRQNESETLLGGVQIDPDPAVWLYPNPVAALEFILAGATAEDELFGDTLDGSHVGDFKVWRQGMGMTDAQTLAQIDERLGEPFADVVIRTRQWVRDNRTRIGTTAKALSGSSSLGDGLHAVSAGPWAVSHAQVAAAAAP
jgi:hypothetical protein